MKYWNKVDLKIY